MQTFYWKGDKAKYTGRNHVYAGCIWFQFKLLDGHLRGQLFHTSRCPDCKMKFEHNKVHCPACSI